MRKLIKCERDFERFRTEIENFFNSEESLGEFKGHKYKGGAKYPFIAFAYKQRVNKESYDFEVNYEFFKEEDLSSSGLTFGRVSKGVLLVLVCALVLIWSVRLSKVLVSAVETPDLEYISQSHVLINSELEWNKYTLSQERGIDTSISKNKTWDFQDYEIINAQNRKPLEYPVFVRTEIVKLPYKYVVSHNFVYKKQLEKVNLNEFFFNKKELAWSVEVEQLQNRVYVLEKHTEEQKLVVSSAEQKYNTCRESLNKIQQMLLPVPVNPAP